MELPSNHRLEQIAADHEAVEEAIERMRGEVRRLSSVAADAHDPGELARLLEGFRALLRDHFAREENEEFLGSAFLLDAEQRQRFDQILLQHRGFLERVDWLIADVAAFRPERAAELAGALESLSTNLRWHDAIETGLFRKLARRG
jgi:hypothetical protein